MDSRHIAFTTRRTALGSLLVAASERGVCRVALGGSGAALEAALRIELPAAAFVRGSAQVDRWADALAAACEGRGDASRVPIDVAGSRFQRRVWDALRRIPRGETRTYGELAHRLGAPRGARAVARACATNPAPLAVPCHRVVPQAGGVGGYRFGSRRKRALLAVERTPRST